MLTQDPKINKLGTVANHLECLAGHAIQIFVTHIFSCIFCNSQFFIFYFNKKEHTSYAALVFGAPGAQCGLRWTSSGMRTL